MSLIFKEISARGSDADDPSIILSTNIALSLLLAFSLIAPQKPQLAPALGLTATDLELLL